jgi:hypothetical protein
MMTETSLAELTVADIRATSKARQAFEQDPEAARRATERGWRALEFVHGTLTARGCTAAKLRAAATLECAPGRYQFGGDRPLDPGVAQAFALLEASLLALAQRPGDRDHLGHVVGYVRDLYRHLLPWKEALEGRP